MSRVIKDKNNKFLLFLNHPREKVGLSTKLLLKEFLLENFQKTIYKQEHIALIDLNQKFKEKGLRLGDFPQVSNYLTICLKWSKERSQKSICW